MENRWIHPQSNQHKVLELLKDTPRTEAEVCMKLGLSQGYNAATIFNFAHVYSLVYHKGHRHCEPLNSRGEIVLGHLNNGFSVNLRDLSVSKSKAKKAAAKSYTQKLRITYNDAKHLLLRHFAKNPAEMRVADAYPRWNTTQANKAAIQLGNAGLLEVVKRGRTTYAKGTELGRLIYETELEPGEFEYYEGRALEVTRSILRNAEEAMRNISGIYGSYNDIAALAHAMTTFEFDYGVGLDYTYPKAEQMQADVHADIRKFGPKIFALLKDKSFYEPLTSWHVERLVGAVNKLVETNVIQLDEELGEFLMMAKLRA